MGRGERELGGRGREREGLVLRQELMQLRELGGLNFAELSGSSDKTHAAVLRMNPTGQEPGRKPKQSSVLWVALTRQPAFTEKPPCSKAFN